MSDQFDSRSNSNTGANSGLDGYGDYGETYSAGGHPKKKKHEYPDVEWPDEPWVDKPKRGHPTDIEWPDKDKRGHPGGTVTTVNPRIAKIIGIGVFVLIFGPIVCIFTFTLGLSWGISALHTADNDSRAFLQALANDNYDTAFDMLSSELQAEYGSAGGLDETLAGRGDALQRVGRLQGESIAGDEAATTHTVTLEGGATTDAAVYMRWVEEREMWTITGFRFD